MHMLMIKIAAPAFIASTALLSGCAGAQKPFHVRVVGASVSNGFELVEFLPSGAGGRTLADKTLGRKVSDEEFARRTRSVALAPMIRAGYRGQQATVSDHSDKYMFFSPLTKGRKQLDAALGQPVDLVVGLDFTFWLGYGAMRAKDAADRREARLALQAKGLALIDEKFAKRKVPLILGDYPDLTGAVPMMISAAMIPTPETQKVLNDRLRTWAATRPWVKIFPLAKLLQKLRKGELREPGKSVDSPVKPESAFQLAMVHPTRLGMALLTGELLTFMREKFPKGRRPGSPSLADLMAVEAKPSKPARAAAGK